MDILDQMEAWRKNARFISEQDFFSRMIFEIRTNRNEIERLREQESKMTTHALVQMEEIERLREVVMLLVAYDEHDEDIQKGAVMWDVLIEAAHAALKENE